MIPIETTANPRDYLPASARFICRSSPSRPTNFVSPQRATSSKWLRSGPPAVVESRVRTTSGRGRFNLVLRSGQVTLRRLVGWHDLATISEQPEAA